MVCTKACQLIFGMCHHDNGDFRLFQRFLHQGCRFVIECGCDFIQQQDIGLERQCNGQ